jgi:flagellar motor switch protein FliG
MNRSAASDLNEDEADEVLAKRQARKAVQRIEFLQVSSDMDPTEGLNRLVPYQIATAIRHDQPKTIALILSQMMPENAARVLEELPSETRAAAFIHLSQPLNVPRMIIDKVLQSAFDRANAVREQIKESDRVEQLVELMRSLPKKVRTELLAKLVEESEELAENVKSKLYRFDDLMRLDDRSVQAVLSRISSTTLVMALTRGEKTLTTKMFNNMSKRARQTIEEEIGFNEKATDDEIAMSRLEIAQTIGKMDEAGEISL